jgi:hypothetical protein
MFRAVARAMKTRATARVERKKTQPDSTHRGIFFNGAGDGLNPRVCGSTRAVAPSSSHIEKLVILYACGLQILSATCVSKVSEGMFLICFPL